MRMPDHSAEETKRGMGGNERMLKAVLIITGIILAIVIVLFIAGAAMFLKMKYEDELLG